MLTELKEVDYEAARRAVLVLQLAADGLVLDETQKQLIDFESRGNGLQMEILLELRDILNHFDAHFWLEALHGGDSTQRLGRCCDTSLVVVREHGTEEANQKRDLAAVLASEWEPGWIRKSYADLLAGCSCPVLSMSQPENQELRCLISTNISAGCLRCRIYPWLWQ